MKHTNVYIVDDSLTIRAMMQSLIEQDDTFEVCGLAANAEQALGDISTAQPEVILLDLALPSVDGLTFLDRVQELIHDPWAAMKVIVVSSSAKHDAPICSDAFRRGAAACFDKARVCAQSAEFMSLLREVSQGDIHRTNHPSDAITLPAWLATDDNADHDDAPLEGAFEIVDKDADLPDSVTFI
jgi:chemotaxis response regulator CheB